MALKWDEVKYGIMKMCLGGMIMELRRLHRILGYLFEKMRRMEDDDRDLPARAQQGDVPAYVARALIEKLWA